MSEMKREFERDNPEMFRGSGLTERMSDDDRMSEIDQEQFFDRVLEEDQRILDSEGPYRVNGVDFGSLVDAEIARGFEAERRVRAVGQSMDRYLRRRADAIQVQSETPERLHQGSN